MDKDSKLIFEKYNKNIVLEQLAVPPVNPALVYGAGAAAQYSPTVLGGLFVMFDNISKWAYSQSEEGKRVQITNEINLTNDKIREIKSVVNNLDVAVQSKNSNALIQNLRYSTNLLMSSNDENVIRLGQNSSKIDSLIEQDLKTQENDSNVNAQLASLLATEATLINTIVGTLITSLNDSSLSIKQDIITLINNVNNDYKNAQEAFTKWINVGGVYIPKGVAKDKGSEKSVVATGGGGPPIDPEEQRKYEKEMREKGREAARQAVDRERIKTDVARQQLEREKIATTTAKIDKWVKIRSLISLRKTALTIFVLYAIYWFMERGLVKGVEDLLVAFWNGGKRVLFGGGNSGGGNSGGGDGDLSYDE